MNVLILGSGGREHAFAKQISKSALLDKLFVAPGNAGTMDCAQNVAISVGEFDKIEEFVINNNIKLVLVGPEDPLVNGIYDFFQDSEDLRSIPLIGPSKLGAQLEGSKEFSKEFMKRHQIPTARFNSFTLENLDEGFAFIETLESPYVLKADGLAAGKGVLILEDQNEAKKELRNMIEGAKFGKASKKVVIEEYLDGIELSVFVLTDGKDYLVLPEAKDYKRIGEGDTGLNTGGMGAVSPVPFADIEFMKKVEEQIIKPTVNGLNSESIPYKGFIFIGLMNVKGHPFVIEYNVRMGDPETEVVLPRIESDLLAHLLATGNGTLREQKIKVNPKTALTVVVVSGGYPETYAKGKEISGIRHSDDTYTYHAGTVLENGIIKTSGGRVLAVTSIGNSISDAREKSYQVINDLHFDDMNYRNDIGEDLLKYEGFNVDSGSVN